MKRAGVICWIAGLATWTAASASAAGFGVVDVTAAFPVGPYLALTVDPADAERAVVTTASGRIAWTSNGGETTTEALILAPRSYLSAPLRSRPPLFSLLEQGLTGRSQLSGLAGEPPGTRRFLLQINNHQPTAKWQYWMSVEDPVTDVLDATVPTSGRPAAAATSGGVFVSDSQQGAWLRTAGAPQPRGEGLVAFSVAVDPADPARMFAGTSHGLLVSRDGGATFRPHPDPVLADLDVRRLTWDPGVANHLLAVTARAVYQSHDGGLTFARAFGSDDGIHAVGLGADGAYVATGRGLIVPEADHRAFPGESVIGVVPLGDGGYLAATETALVLHAGDGNRVLMRTTASDPFLRLEGNATAAWAITRYGVFRVGEELARAPRLSDPPRMENTPDAVERDVLARTGLGDPTRTRLGKPPAAYLIPKLTVLVRGVSLHDYTTDSDAALPFPVHLTTTSSGSSCCGSPLDERPESVVLLTWDLAGLFSPTRTPTYPYGIVELNLRAARDQILPEVRWRYREAARLAALLARPPRDAGVFYLWQMRLAEHAAYLEAMSGRPVVNFGSITPF